MVIPLPAQLSYNIVLYCKICQLFFLIESLFNLCSGLTTFALNEYCIVLHQECAGTPRAVVKIGFQSKYRSHTGKKTFGDPRGISISTKP